MESEKPRIARANNNDIKTKKKTLNKNPSLKNNILMNLYS